MKENWKVWIKGVLGRGNEVIKALTDLGAKNTYSLTGNNEKIILYIDHKGNICSTGSTYETACIIKDNYKEIKLSDNWKDGDILVNDDNPNEFYVFNSFTKSSEIFIYLKIIKSSIVDKPSTISISDICTFIPSYTPCHKANNKELRIFYSILAVKNLTWDAYNKILLDGNYTYFYPKNSHYYTKINTIRCKDRTTGEWYDAILYSDINGQYVRELNDFNKKFKKI